MKKNYLFISVLLVFSVFFYTKATGYESSGDYQIKRINASAFQSGDVYDFGTVLVKNGVKGLECKAWQMFLNDYAKANLKVDSWCGSRTISAAKSWQASVKITADGLLGKDSRKKAKEKIDSEPNTPTGDTSGSQTPTDTTIPNDSTANTDTSGNSATDTTSNTNTTTQNPLPTTTTNTSNTSVSYDYYASPSGTGNGLSINSPFKIANFWSVAQPGDKLGLLDGHYVGVSSMINPPSGLSGTASAPITIRAVNDGQVDIDGQFQREPVILEENDWFVLEGFNAHSAGPAGSSASVLTIKYADNNIVRRVVGWDATDGNSNIFGVHNSNNTLIEDAAGFGVARKIFSNSQNGNNTTFRRTFARWEGNHTDGPKLAYTLAYNSVNALYENVIATWDPLMLSNDYQVTNYEEIPYVGSEYHRTGKTAYRGGSLISDDGQDYPTNARLLGSIAFVAQDQQYHNELGQFGVQRNWAAPILFFSEGTTVKDTISVLEGPVNQSYYSMHLQGGNAANSKVTNSTLIGGIQNDIIDSDDGASWTFQNNYLSSNGAALVANGGNILDPTHNNIPNAANVMKRYVNGVKTDQDLWPWPMNARILSAMTQANRKPMDVTKKVFELMGGTMPNFSNTSNTTSSNTSSSSTTNTNTGIFNYGDRVEVNATSLNVRATASVNGALLGSQPDGAFGTVIGGPVYSGGYTWWNINYDSGPDGWSVENYLLPYTPPSTTTNNTTSNTSSTNVADIVNKAKQWLNATPANRAMLEPELSSWTSNIDQVIAQVKPNPSTYTETQTGKILNQSFHIPEFINKYPNHQYHMYVPSQYNKNTSMGLMIWMHGGGSWTPEDLQHIADYEMDDETFTHRSGPRTETDHSNYILVAPIAPFGSIIPHPQHASRWDVPVADQYLMDIITEVASRYNVDYNKVVIAGFSMGGIGAYNQALRLNDRVSAVMASAGSWELGSWGSLKDTPMYLIHGATDAYFNSTSDCRAHNTAIEFARAAKDLLPNDSNHVLKEYPGGHGWDDIGQAAWTTFINGMQGWVTNKVRDPYRTHVSAINPWRSYDVESNYGVSWSEDPSPDTLWVSIKEIGTGTIPYDYAKTQGSGSCSSLTDWNNWSLTKTTKSLNGGKVEANITGNNQINVVANNVKKMSLWINPEHMQVNPSLPVNVTVNGVNMQKTCSPSLLAALKSYERRDDWSMIYHCEIPIDIQ